MKKISILLSAVVLLGVSASAYAEYSANDDFIVQKLSVTDQNYQAVTAINDDTESVYIEALVKNPSWDGSVVMLAGIYDGETDKMKYLEQSAEASITKYYRGNLDVEIDSSELAAAGAKTGDKIKLYVWDSASGMQQMTDCISSEDFSGFSSQYSTNNITDYNMHINEVRGDNWSYLVRYRDMTNTSALLSASMSLAKQETGNTNGIWYTDPNGKRGNWYISPDGTVKTETARLLGYNYTIGELTAGCKLSVKGTFTGEDNVTLYVLKTTDSIESVSGYGKGAIGYTDTWLTDNVYKTFVNLPASDGKFEFEIPASEAVAGNDITFWINRTGGSTSASNKLDITITVNEEESEEVLNESSLEEIAVNNSEISLEENIFDTEEDITVSQTENISEIEEQDLTE